MKFTHLRLDNRISAARLLRLPNHSLSWRIPWGLTALALTIGAGSGLGAVAFRWLIDTFTLLFSGHEDYAAAGHAAHPYVPQLGMWFLLLIPPLGGLLYGPLIEKFANEARGHGVPEVMASVTHDGGRIAPRVVLVKSLASALCIGSGGSVGKEGPIVQIGSALGSVFGRLARMDGARLRLLVACGAAGGIAATFNAPLAGVFFAMELILGEFTVRTFGLLVLSSATASILSRILVGSEVFLTLPSFDVDHPAEYLLFAGVGIVAGAVGTGFSRLLYLVEDTVARIWRGPRWLRPAVGGLLLGALLLVLPQLYGVGYPALRQAIEGQYVIWFLLALLVGKMLATSLTLGIGGSGGVFAPSLFLGAVLGTACGILMHSVAPTLAGPAGAYGVVGMGAVFAGATRAPITATIVIVELTGEYALLLPLMLAVALATGVSRLLSAETIYTMKLRRREAEPEASPLPAARG